MTDQVSRVVVDIELNDQDERVASPRLIGCTKEEAAEALRAAITLLAPPGFDTYPPEADPTWAAAAAEVVTDGDWRRNYGAGIVAALLAVAEEQRTANMIAHAHLLSVVAGRRPSDAYLDVIAARLVEPAEETDPAG